MRATPRDRLAYRHASPTSSASISGPGSNPPSVTAGDAMDSAQLTINAGGVGMDRTVITGTGYIGQYPAPLAGMYESLATCPDNLLLFMHHVPYTYRLHSGQTWVMQVHRRHPPLGAKQLSAAQVLVLENLLYTVKSPTPFTPRPSKRP